jgi:hypothetical protein
MPYVTVGKENSGTIDCQFSIARTSVHREHDGEHRDSRVCVGAHIWTVCGALVNSALVVSCRGDIRRTDHGPSERRHTDSIRSTSVPNGSGLSVCCIALRHRIQRRLAGTFFPTLYSGRLDGAGHGHAGSRCPEARNPGSDDNRPDTNDHGHRRGLFAREWQQPETGEKS